MKPDPVVARDAGLRRISRFTRGAVAGGLALTGVFSAIAAHAFPGRSGRQATASVPPPTEAVAPPAAPTTTLPPTTVPNSVPGRTAVTAVHRALQPPATAPRPVVQTPVTVARRVRPHVVSGGS